MEIFYRIFNTIFFKKDTLIMAFYHSKPIRFKCTECSRCCYGGKYAYVRASSQEIEKIISFMNINADTFKADYLIKLVDNGYGIRMKITVIAQALNKKGPCMLLSAKGKCSVYPVRPMQCRTYPFWSEILISEAKWNSEIERCEGIQQGEIIETEYIEQQKELSVNAEIIINESIEKPVI